jgi:hypothetical protein
MKDYNFNIIMFWINRNYLVDEFYIAVLTIAIGEGERALFSFFTDGRKTEIDLLFIHFRF